MRKAIILARPKGALHLQVISGPEISRNDQVKRFKEFCASPSSGREFEHVELWESDGGMTRRKRFKPVASAPVIPPPPELEELSATGLLAIVEEEKIQLPVKPTQKAIIGAIRDQRAKRAAAAVKVAVADPGTFDGEDDRDDDPPTPPLIPIPPA